MIGETDPTPSYLKYRSSRKSSSRSEPGDLRFIRETGMDTVGDAPRDYIGRRTIEAAKVKGFTLNFKNLEAQGVKS